MSRHRLACTSAAVVMVSFILGITISTRQAVRALNAEDKAKAERYTARSATQSEMQARSDAQCRQAQAEDLLGLMLGDFRTELARISRLGLLDTVGDKALAHFGSLTPHDLTDTTFARHCRTLTQIGKIRLDHQAQAASKPSDPDLSFDLEESEIWLSKVDEAEGQYPMALAHRQASIARVEALRARNPKTRA